MACNVVTVTGTPKPGDIFFKDVALLHSIRIGFAFNHAIFRRKHEKIEKYIKLFFKKLKIGHSFG